MATTKTKSKKDEKKVEETHPLILGARITEKSSKGADQGIYTFNVREDANKSEIKKAIKKLYKVEPTKISITKITPKTVVRRGIIGTKQGGKKAVVFLKKGDKIAFV
ncbi:MAG: 50S ribosomal protein L23 [Patescibacteria group bacterium]